MKKTLLIIGLILAASFAWFGFAGEHKKLSKDKTDYSWLQEGDILFQDFEGDFGEAIKLATKSNYSHCGMILKKGGKLMVYEAVGPVKFTPLKEWIKHGTNNSFIAKRLDGGFELPITPQVCENWKKQARNYTGKAYDHVFGWTDEKMYCSELVWKMYKNGRGIELSKPKKLKEFDLSHPLVKQQLEMRYGKDIPYEENVVSPQDLFESNLLVEVQNPVKSQ